MLIIFNDIMILIFVWYFHVFVSFFNYIYIVHFKTNNKIKIIVMKINVCADAVYSWTLSEKGRPS